jgi:hypothetical protein
MQLGMLAGLVILLIGPEAALTKALTDAARGCPAAAKEAKCLLDALPALLRARVLCPFVCLTVYVGFQRRRRNRRGDGIMDGNPTR